MCIRDRSNGIQREDYGKEQEIGEAIAAAGCGRHENLAFLQNTFSSWIESAAFVWGQDCYGKGILIDSVYCD